MTLKINMMQPEQMKIQDKYKGRTDQASQQRMQMEMMELYKKYKINFMGCLMPFLQIPIFIAMYQVVQRFPLTDTAVFNGGVASPMNIQFLWTNLGSTDWLPNLPLALLVGVTMWLSQYLAQQRILFQLVHHLRARQAIARHHDGFIEQLRWDGQHPRRRPASAETSAWRCICCATITTRSRTGSLRSMS